MGALRPQRVPSEDFNAEDGSSHRPADHSVVLICSAAVRRRSRAAPTGRRRRAATASKAGMVLDQSNWQLAEGCCRPRSSSTTRPAATPTRSSNGRSASFNWPPDFKAVDREERRPVQAQRGRVGGAQLDRRAAAVHPRLSRSRSSTRPTRRPARRSCGTSSTSAWYFGSLHAAVAGELGATARAWSGAPIRTCASCITTASPSTTASRIRRTSASSS